MTTHTTEGFTPRELADDFNAILPGFKDAWERDWIDIEWGEKETLPSVYSALLDFLGRRAPTPKQWQKVADVLSREFAAGGTRENIVDTCVLEHLHQLGMNRQLRPLLSPEARNSVKR